MRLRFPFIHLGLENRIEKAAASLFAIAFVVFIGTSFTEPHFAFLVLVDATPESTLKGNGALILALYCFAAVLYMLLLSLLKNPGSWFLLTFSIATLWGAGNVAFYNLNVLLDTSAALKTSGRLINVREAKGRRARGNVITFDIDTPLTQRHRYEAGDRNPSDQLFSISKDGARVEFCMCEGYFQKPYVCSRRL